ncbi:hypothetical protein OKW30_003550 [Paraburkholderia sp. Clong3]
MYHRTRITKEYKVSLTAVMFHLCNVDRKRLDWAIRFFLDDAVRSGTCYPLWVFCITR